MRNPVKLLVWCLVGHASCAIAVFTNNWSVGKCSGPPESMFRFKVSDPTGRYTSNTEMWPQIYRFFSKLHYTLGQCAVGKTPSLDSIQCCANLIYNTGLGVESTSIDIQRDTDEQSIPVTANGAQYCRFISTLSAQAWFTEAFILEGHCSEGVSCELGGSFFIYQSGKCEDTSRGVSKTRDLSLVSKDYRVAYTDAYYNLTRNVTLSSTFGMISNGQLEYVWQQYVPSNSMFFEFKDDPWEYLAAVGAVCGFLLIFVSIGFISKRIHRKGPQKDDVFHLIGQLIWLGVLIIYIAFLQVGYTTQQSEETMLAFALVAPAMATFYTCIHCSSIVMKAAGLERHKVICTYIFLTMLHIATAGSQYFYKFISVDTYISWKGAVVVWNVCALLTILSVRETHHSL
jgi:hypothetical protein